MVEAHVQSNLKDALVPGLQFSPSGSSAEYVSSSKMVRFYAESGDRFSQASKVIRFRLIDDCWMQAGSARMQVTLNNLSSAPLTPIAHPACMFSQARLYLGGQLVETLDENQVLSTLVDRFKPAWRHITDSMENHVINPADGSRLALRANQSRRLIFELPFGLLKQENGFLFTFCLSS